MGYVKCEVSIYRLRRNREEQHRSIDELQRTKKNRETLMNLRKEERTYYGRRSSGGVLRNSGTNRSMQQPTVRQRRGLTMAAALECGDDVKKKKG